MSTQRTVAGFDTGGTFTDFVLQNERGELQIWKRLSTPAHPSEAVFTGLTECWGRDLDALTLILGSTTLVSNCVIERKGAVTALVTTAGHPDILEMGRELRADLYDLLIDRVTPLIPRTRVFELVERIAANGEIVTPIDAESVAALLEWLGTAPIDSVAVCLLHAYRNPRNEEEIGRRLAARYPDLCISLSSEVAPEIREYERASTVAINAYAQPAIKGYIGGLKSEFAARGFHGAFLMMASHGGLMDNDAASRFPVRLMESGPAAGALAAAHIARGLGRRRVLSFDMGGTTAKLCLICDGVPALGSESEVAQAYRFKRGSGFPVKFPMVQMIEIGAGGGSLAAINHLGLLRVGPQSAGASPGPACYALGGEHPTVTDADLTLGYLDPQYFLGGRMRLDEERARRALSDHVAIPGGLSLERAAWGIHDLVNENMASAARVHITENAFDPRDFDLVAFGGAGPVHAYGVARRLGVRHVIVPPLAGVLSSLGLLVAPPSVELSRSYPLQVEVADWREVERLFDAMAVTGRTLLAAAGVPAPEISLQRRVDMRYAGQGFEVPIDIPVGTAGWPQLVQAFEATYRRLFGRTIDGVRIEAVTWRLGVAGQSREIGLPRWSRSGPRIKGERAIYVPDKSGKVPVPVYDRYALVAGDSLDGPAVVEEDESTVIVSGPARVRVDERLNLVLDLGG
jgi:N-methylhydantoinase A